jgi:hypothetical protein
MNNESSSNNDDDEPLPSPGHVTVDAGNGTQRSVERTPYNVVRWGLDDPFPTRNPDRKRRCDEEEEDDDDDDDDGLVVDLDADGSSVSDNDTNVVEAGSEVICPGLAHQLLSDLHRSTYWRYRLRDGTVTFNGGYPVPSGLTPHVRRFRRSARGLHGDLSGIST